MRNEALQEYSPSCAIHFRQERTFHSMERTEIYRLKEIVRFKGASCVDGIVFSGFDSCNMQLSHYNFTSATCERSAFSKTIQKSQVFSGYSRFSLRQHLQRTV